MEVLTPEVRDLLSRGRVQRSAAARWNIGIMLLISALYGDGAGLLEEAVVVWGALVSPLMVMEKVSVNGLTNYKTP